MTFFPVPLDNLITYVRTLHPDGGPLANLSDAVVVSGQLAERADDLLGHFVDRARRSGASWSEIGTSMGVSKQAVQKRFVARWDGTDPVPADAAFSRFTLRARTVLVGAHRSAEASGGAAIDDVDIAVALLVEPDGLAARIVHDAGITDAAFAEELGRELPAHVAARADALDTLSFTDAGNEVLRGTLRAALRLGHNYIGTEHLLLGVLVGETAAGAALVSLGLTVDGVEHAVAAEVGRIQQERSG